VPRAKPQKPEVGSLEPAAWIALGAWALALLAASPDSTSMWGFNGFRSASSAWPLLVLAAALAWALGRFRPQSPWAWRAAGLALALAPALAWREKIHFLGDTQLRMRTLFAERLPRLGEAWGEWAAHASQTLHASPLDLLVDVVPAVRLHEQGARIADAVAWTGIALALVYLVLAWRLARRLLPGSDVAAPLALAIVLTGTLEAFAGYADSAGLVAVVAIGWWTEILSPLDRSSRAWRATLWFAALILTHRVGAAMLLPQLLRAAGPPIEGDRPEARRTLLVLTTGVLAIAVGATLLSAAGRQLLRDLTEIARSIRASSLRPLDGVSALIVVAPLALIAPWLAGRAGRAFWRTPRAAWILAGALPLLIALMWVFPFGENGLGLHRDWDTNVLLGVTLTVGAAVFLSGAGQPKLRAALPVTLPLLAITALSWVAVNADVGLATRRAIALATSPHALTDPQRAHLHAYFGQRAMDERHPEVAAPHYEQAFREGGNPRRALLAAEAWLLAGNEDAARAAIAAARGRGPLSSELEADARQIESHLAPSDSSRTP